VTPLVLLHGGGLGSWSWQRHIALLSGEFDCHAPDLPGHLPGSVFTMEAAVDQVASLLTSFDQPAVLAGLSLGGQLATAVAAEHPSLVRAVVASGVNAVGIPGLGLLLASLPMVRVFSKSRAMSRASGRAMGVPPTELDRFVDHGRALTTEQLAAIYRSSHAHRVPVTLPTGVLVLAGSKEPSPIRRSLPLFAAAGATTAVVPGGKHTWPLADPDLFASCVRTWVGSARVPASLAV
jgi:pimeloyl-ACP methyl ester carboxylesterase